MSSFYQREHVKGDILGGLTSVMVSLPGNIVFGLIAFAPLGQEFAGIGILAGFFCSIFGGFFASMFSGTPGMITGAQAPGAILFAAVVTKLMDTGAFGIGSDFDAISIITLSLIAVFLSGLFQLLFGALKLGGLVKYISYPVISGIINGTAILMIIGQLHHCLGMEKQPITQLIGDIGNIQPLTALVSIVTMVVMLWGGKIVKAVPSAIVSILVGTALYYVLIAFAPNIAIGPQIGVVPSGAPSFKYVVHASEALSGLLEWKYLAIVLQGALAIAAISSIDSLLSSAALQNITNQRTNPNRELIGQGIGNMMSSLFGGLAGAGFVGRSTANYEAGGRTRLSGMICSAVLLLILVLFAKWIGMIPQVVMSSVVVVLGIKIIDPWTFNLIRDLLNNASSNKNRLVTNLVTILLVMGVAIFVDFILAVGIGIVVSIALFVKDMSTSVIRHVYRGSTVHSKKMRNYKLMQQLKEYGDRIAVIELQSSIFFGATDTLLDKIDALSDDGAQYIILDFRRVNHIDATGYKIFSQTFKRLAREGIVLSFAYFSEDSKFWTEIQDFGLEEKIGDQMFFPETDLALEHFEDDLLHTLDSRFSDEYEMPFDELFGSLGFEINEVETMRSKLERIEFKSGELIFHWDDEGDGMYFLARGIADIYIDLPDTERDKRIYTVTYGTVFGEMALLDDKPRSASVIAKTKMVCYKMTTGRFNQLKLEQPELAMKCYKALCQILVNRLRDANTLISELEE